MKIAISSQGTEQTADVDPRFGRTKWFILYDTETGSFESINNDQVLDLPQGAGIQAAQQVVGQNAGVVLTGHCGPNAFRTLNAAGVQVVIGVSGPVDQAVKQYQAGRLKPAVAADVAGHW
jgi:predicted Fe-Mo cluster-binding NifX family protein